MAYEKVKFKKLMEIMLFNKPSIEKMVKLFSSIAIIVFNLSTRFVKLMDVPNKLLPSSCMLEEIQETKKISLSHMKIEEFMHMPKIISLKMKLVGLSVWVIRKLDNSSFTA